MFYCRFFWRFSTLQKDYDPRVLPSAAATYIVDEMIARYKDETTKKFVKETALSKVHRSILSHLKNGRQNQRKEIIEALKVQLFKPCRVINGIIYLTRTLP